MSSHFPLGALNDSLPGIRDWQVDNSRPALLLLALLLVLAGPISAFSRRTKNPPKFSGPKGLPLIGNAHQLGGQKQFLKYTEWHKTFGPVYSLNLVGQHVVVVGTAKAAADLMERRSAIYSDRPRFIMATEILTGGMNMAFARWGARWKRMRRAANFGLSMRASQQYIPLQEQEAVHLLDGLLHESGSIDPHLRRTAAATVLTSVYAYYPVKLGDPLVHKVEQYVDRMLKAALPGNYLVDLFPWMMYIPKWMASWKREGYAWFKKDTDMFLGVIDDVKEGMKSGERTDCLVASLLNNPTQHDLDTTEIAWLAGMMFGAGGEAMAASLSVFVLAMLLYPRVQARLKAEIDEVSSSERPPTYALVKDLPYLNAVIKETLRWRPMGPLAVPHRSTQDDVYEGHFIPAGTLIFPNVWAMHHDESVYPSPEEFYPERHLSKDGITPVSIPETKELGHHGYGFGRRSCIGYTVANNALLINAASILWAFDISKAKDASGKEITPDPNDMLDEGLAVRPSPYQCRIEPRSAARAEIIEALRATV